MRQLNELEIGQIEQTLRKNGVGDRTVRAELLDHVCCQVESKLAEGLNFQGALTASLQTFQVDEMKEIQASSLAVFHKKYSVMKKLSFAALITMLLICSAYWLKDEKPAASQPVLKVQDALVSLFEPPSRSPLEGDAEITSGFGMRVHPIQKIKKQHNGIDFKAATGTPVLATSAGKVVKAAFDKNYGNYVVIKHDEHYQSLYAQLSTMVVKVGDSVAKGEKIGEVGSSGLSTAPHLHYEVIKDGEYENPATYLHP
ncbi:MAG: peptidoglycan DD-metalloendopeptidase family protein [Bacteroidetes bacterium]|nr:peptidoglycan DD-metalloendopeptidase family protein [Bacteroidota bacterium]